MKITDDESKKELPELEPGDVIKAIRDGKKYYFLTTYFLNDDYKRCYAMIWLNRQRDTDISAGVQNGAITVEGIQPYEFSSLRIAHVAQLMGTLMNSGFTNIEKVELEARVKHEKD